MGREERAGGAAEQYRLQATRTGNPAGEFEQTAQSDAERHFIDSGPEDVAGNAKEPVAGGLRGAYARVSRAAAQDNFGNTRERFDVVDHRGLPEKACLGRKRGFVARLTVINNVETL